MIAGLDALLAALRAAGLTVGATEVLRLQAVFAREPRLGPEGEPAVRLRTLVRAVVVKSRDDDATFERIFGAWIERAEGVGGGWAKREWPDPPLVPPSRWEVFRARLERAWRRSRWAAAMAVVLAGLALVGEQSPARQESRPLPKVVMLQLDPLHVGVRERRPEGWEILHVTRILRPPPSRRDELWLLALGLLALAGAIELTWLAARRRFFPPPVPFTPAPGPARAFLTPPAARGPLLLDPTEEETVAYGVGRFVSEEVTRRLDARATVRATVRAAGVPRLVFHRARFHREVWLWLDETADSPTLVRAADEVEAILLTHGLPVERAGFRGAPFRLVGKGGLVFAPNEVDERRDAAIVAVLTDGRLLALQGEAGESKLRLQVLLRSLASWPRLAFFDPSGGAHCLAALLGPYGLAALPLSQLAAFLGGSRPRLRRPAAGSLDLWAAVCALASTPVSAATALALRRRLSLPVPAWALPALAAEAPGPAGRLSWEPAERARRLDRLAAGERPAASSVGESLLGRALTAWEEVFAAEEEKRREAPAVWDGTLAQRRLAMERSLLRLWRAPEVAAHELYELFVDPLRSEITEHLRHLAPAGLGTDQQARLPWRWESLRPATQARLLEMKLAGGMPGVRLRRSVAVWVVLGLLFGVGATEVGIAAVRNAKPAPGRKTARVDMDFVKILGGRFLMGSREGDRRAFSQEKPAHEVTVSTFWMGRTEVTNRQYQIFPLAPSDLADLPATSVSWFEADRFCRSLGYRLPAEAEWEYAARAGKETSWSFGDNEAELEQYAWYEGNSRGKLHAVATKLPNAWGLYDMYGNAWEWAGDWFGPYSKEAGLDPRGPEFIVDRTLRGGSFAFPARNLRSANRVGFWPEVRNGDIGFRCVLSPHP